MKCPRCQQDTESENCNFVAKVIQGVPWKCGFSPQTHHYCCNCDLELVSGAHGSVRVLDSARFTEDLNNKRSVFNE